MIVKSMLLVSGLAMAPIALMSSMQDPRPVRPSQASGATDEDAVETLRREIERLRTAVAEQSENAADLEQRLDRALAQLREALDLIVEARPREHHCAPSRELLTDFQWMHERGHHAHAARALERLIESQERNPERLHRLASELLHDGRADGSCDAAALALVEHLLEIDRDPNHRVLDTAACAHFLNGEIEAAVSLQQRAAQAQPKNDDYRRRLRTYSAALAAVQAATRAAGQPEPLIAATPMAGDAASSHED